MQYFLMYRLFHKPARWPYSTRIQWYAARGCVSIAPYNPHHAEILENL